VYSYLVVETVKIGEHLNENSKSRDTELIISKCKVGRGTGYEGQKGE
jgi:hypothetical protein